MGIDFPESPIIWARDEDGTGSMHVCSKGDEGAVAYGRLPLRTFWIVLYDGSAWDTRQQAVDWAQGERESLIVEAQQVSEFHSIDMVQQ